MKKRADGRYCKQVFVGYHSDGRRKFKTLYGKTKKVELLERELRFRLDQGIITTSDYTVGTWAAIWLKRYKTDVEYNTYRRYETIIENQIKPSIGDINLADLKLRHCQMVINGLVLTHSLSTIRKSQQTLNQLCKCAVIEGIISSNPCDGVFIPKSNKFKDASDYKKFISDDEISAINTFSETDIDGAIIMTLLYTGVRRGEITALTWGDINFEDKYISVDKSAEFIVNQPHIKTPKTISSIRKIPLLDILIPYLKKPANARMSDPVFLNSNGTMHTDISHRRLMERFNKNFSKYVNHNTKITMHMFRHAYATLLYKAGVDIKTAQTYMGHSSITVTLNIYTHLDLRFKEVNASKLNEFCSQVAI